MDKRLKKGLIIGAALMLLLIVGTIVANTIIKNKIKEALGDFSQTINIQYQDIQVNTLRGRVKFLYPKIFVYGKTTNKVNLEIELKEFALNNLSYWEYLFNDKINIEHISIVEPKAIYQHNEQANLSAAQSSYNESFDETIEIGTIEIINGNMEVVSMGDGSLILKTEEINFEINDVSTNKAVIEEKIPFNFKDYQVIFKKMFYRMNDFENLMVEHVNFNTHFYRIKNLGIKTQLSPVNLSNQISVEKDHFDLTVDSIMVSNHDFGIKNDTIFYFDSKQVDLYQPNFKIYRDKLVEDDPTYKPLYSKSLRNLNFDLHLQHVSLHDAAIVYTERVREETAGGVLQFSNLEAKISNLSNTSGNENETTAQINGFFMENTPIKVDWNFNVNDSLDEFVFKAEIGKLNAPHMNQFMEPNLNVRLDGEVEQTYFTINGNDHTSRIDLKLKYDNFDIAILKQNGKEKNKFLSAVVNLFVSKDSLNKSNDFRHGNATDVERDKTKSVFNYLWLNIKEGLLNAMTGDGSKN